MPPFSFFIFYHITSIVNSKGNWNYSTFTFQFNDYLNFLPSTLSRSESIRELILIIILLIVSVVGTKSPRTGAFDNKLHSAIVLIVGSCSFLAYIYKPTQLLMGDYNGNIGFANFKYRSNFCVFILLIFPFCLRKLESSLKLLLQKDIQFKEFIGPFCYFLLSIFIFSITIPIG